MYSVTLFRKNSKENTFQRPHETTLFPTLLVIGQTVESYVGPTQLPKNENGMALGVAKSSLIVIKN